MYCQKWHLQLTGVLLCCLCFRFQFHLSLWLVCTLSFKGRAIFRFLPFLWWSFLYGLHNLNVIAYSRLFPGFSLSAINLEFMTAAVLYKKRRQSAFLLILVHRYWNLTFTVRPNYWPVINILVILFIDKWCDKMPGNVMHGPCTCCRW